MRRLCSIAVMAGFWIVSGCGGGTTSPGGGGGGGGGGNNNCAANTICMGGSIFIPNSLTVPAGTTVTFNNNSSTDHNIVFDAPLPEVVVNIGGISSGSTATRTLGTAGKYNFHCTIHAGMTGSVTAQ